MTIENLKIKSTADVRAFAPASRVWIWQSDKIFSEEQVDKLLDQLSSFCTQWTAHDLQLHAAGSVIEDRIIVLMVDETHAGASGCSIDKAVHFIKSLEAENHVHLFDRNVVNYVSGDKMITTTLQNLDELARTRNIDKETLFIDPLVNTKYSFDASFISALSDCWINDFVELSAQ